ncbi:MAG: heme-binding protein [Hominilimicola sp.]
MKTIEELVGEVAKNLGAGKSAPKKQVNTAKPVSPKTEKKAEVKKSVTENISPQMTLSIAKEIANAVEIAAGIIGVNVVVAVHDGGANLVLLHAMDDSLIASIKASQDKAYTAVALKMPTHTALEEARGGALDGLTNGNGILLLGGGYPLWKGDKIYGGVGVSGGTKEQDTILAMVAAQYFKARVK